MRKLLSLLILLTCITGTCNATTPQDNNTNDGELSIYPFTHSCVSEDGKMSFKSTAHGDHYGVLQNTILCTIKTKNGGKKTFKMPKDEGGNGPYFVLDVHSIKKNDASTFYLVYGFAQSSYDIRVDFMEAFIIENDTIKQVNAYDGKKGDIQIFCSDSYGQHAWFDAIWNYHDDCFFTYDNVTRELYVPLTDDGYITDRYLLLEFNGDCFVKRGIVAHKGLHKSLAQYKMLVRMLDTETYTVRIDELKNGKLRYACWKRSATISSKPDIVIEGGVYNHDTMEYTFKNGEYSYIVGLGNLIVKKGNKILLEQSRR